MKESAENEKFSQISQIIAPQSKLREARPLPGGLSAQMTVLEIELPHGQVQKLVVRRYQDKHFAQAATITKEFQLLQILNTAGLAVPG